MDALKFGKEGINNLELLYNIVVDGIYFDSKITYCRDNFSRL